MLLEEVSARLRACPVSHTPRVPGSRAVGGPGLELLSVPPPPRE